MDRSGTLGDADERFVNREVHPEGVPASAAYGVSTSVDHRSLEGRAVAERVGRQAANRPTRSRLVGGKMLFLQSHVFVVVVGTVAVLLGVARLYLMRL